MVENGNEVWVVHCVGTVYGVYRNQEVAEKRRKAAQKEVSKWYNDLVYVSRSEITV